VPVSATPAIARDSPTASPSSAAPLSTPGSQRCPKGCRRAADRSPQRRRCRRSSAAR
jgi:hypothetical protein